MFVERFGCGALPLKLDSTERLMNRVARNFQLRLTMRTPDQPRVTFDGFKREASWLRLSVR